MKDAIIRSLVKSSGLPRAKVEGLIEIPKDSTLGDFAFPCFTLARHFKKNPIEIAKDIGAKIAFGKEIEKINVDGPYINFFLNSAQTAQTTLREILRKKEKFGHTAQGRGSTFVIDMSSPNIAKPFGVGHLRSTIIGNAVAFLYESLGYKIVRINYLGDWGTPFGKIIAGYKEFGSQEELKKNPIKHLLDVYVKASADERFEVLGREWFRKMEDGDKEALALWKKFRKVSIDEFNKIYKLLNVTFDRISGESEYNRAMANTIKELERKNLLEKSEGAQVINLEKYGLGVCLIKKSDGATLYATRDITAAIDRQKKYKAKRLMYEVGAEQKLYFKQMFKVLELMGHKWARECVHIDHGLYLDNDGKKFATRKGKIVFMDGILSETIHLAKEEILKRSALSKKELEKRALAIARAAILYGDLKNYRGHDMVFDIDRFISFEGDTGPYLLYSYARAKSILRKKRGAQNKISAVDVLNLHERALVNALARFPEIVQEAATWYAPNIIAQYAYTLAQRFNEFYHATPVIGSDKEGFRLTLVSAFAQVLKNALYLLGISVLEEM